MDNRFRHEYKYLITSAQMEIIKSRICHLIESDSHVGDDGMYNIRSLYFDDYYNRCYYENENGTDPREKFRIRIYNHNSDRITLECKRKERSKTLKTTCPLTISQCKMLMNGEVISNIGEQDIVLRKLSVEMLQRLMKPKVIVEYDRIPYVCKMGNVRITFDTNISSSSDIESFLCDNIPKRPVMPNGLHLMEVKWDDFLPDVIYRACQIENLQQTAFSKYYLCRKYGI